MARILITDSLGQAGIEMLRDQGHHVDLLEADDRPRLPELIVDYDALIVRSGTQVDETLLRAGASLRVVGRAGIGVDNIDVKVATELGILVVNAPTANLLSATEHTFALLLAAARKLAPADASLKGGLWDRKSYVGQELYGKTLGVIGFGQIGQRVAERARAFEMQVIAYDPYLSPEVAKRLEVEPMSLEELLPRADALTFHTPLTDETRNMLDARRFELLRDGAIVVNCGRGGVIDEQALLDALSSGKVSAAGIDVFSQEPPPSFELAQHPRVVATPHIGAQTKEAQERVATQTARMVSAALEGSLSVSAVNLPFRGDGSRSEPFLRLAERLGTLAASILGGGSSQIQIDLWGLEESQRASLTVAAIKGALTPFLGEGVNYVNAESVAVSRGLEVVCAVHSKPADWAHLVGITLLGEGAEVEVAGTVYGDNDLRVVRLHGFGLEFRPEGQLLMVHNTDVPGVVGKLGTLIGDAGLNIADIHLARLGPEQALAVIRLDSEPPAELLEHLGGLPEVQRCHSVAL